MQFPRWTRSEVKAEEEEGGNHGRRSLSDLPLVNVVPNDLSSGGSWEFYHGQWDGEGAGHLLLNLRSVVSPAGGAAETDPLIACSGSGSTM